MHSILNHLGFTQNELSIMYEDNTATIAVLNNECAIKRLWHVDLWYFILLNWVNNGNII